MVGLSAIGRLYNPNSSAAYSSANGTVFSKGPQKLCMCSACQGARTSGNTFGHHKPQAKYFNYAQQPTQTQQQAPPSDSGDDGTQEEERIDPLIHKLIPSAEYVANNEIVRSMARDRLPFIYNKTPMPCISAEAISIKPNDKKLREVITEVDKDIQEAKTNHQQLIFARDEKKHAYIEIVNRTGSPLSLAQAIETITKDRKGNEGFPNTYVNGVEFHEIAHAALLEKIPDVNLEEFEQGVRIVITGTTEEPEFEVTTFGQTVFYADKIDEKVTQNQDGVNAAQQEFNQAQSQGFRGYSEANFDKLIGDLKKNVNNLIFLAQESLTLALAAVAPLILQNTAYHEHSVLSAADEKRYAEALTLTRNIEQILDRAMNLLMNIDRSLHEFRFNFAEKYGISTFISRAKDIFAGLKNGNQLTRDDNNIASNQPQRVNSVG